MIRSINMFRVVCDEEGCEESPQDGGDYYAWLDPGSAYDDATGNDWTIRDGLDLCPEHGHRKVCMGNDEQCSSRDVTEADDRWVYCPEHIAESQDGAPD